VRLWSKKVREKFQNGHKVSPDDEKKWRRVQKNRAPPRRKFLTSASR
jgi:hypothetical protein